MSLLRFSQWVVFLLTSAFILSIRTQADSDGSSSVVDIEDHGSFITRYVAFQRYETGLLQLLVNPREALVCLQQSFTYSPSAPCAAMLAFAYEALNDEAAAEHWHQRAVETDPEGVAVLHEMSLGMQAADRGQYAPALYHFEQVLNITNNSHAEAYYQRALSLQYTGDILGSGDAYFSVLQLNPIHTKAMLNLAALHHRYGAVEEAVVYYTKAIHVLELYAGVITGYGDASGVAQELQPDRDRSGRGDTGGGTHDTDKTKPTTSVFESTTVVAHDYIMVRANLALAYMQLGQLQLALVEASGLLKLLQKLQTGMCGGSGRLDAETASETLLLPQCSRLERDISAGRSNLAQIQRASGRWAQWEELYDSLLRDTLNTVQQLWAAMEARGDAAVADREGTLSPPPQPQQQFMGPLLPFDTLLLPLSNQLRLTIAQTASAVYVTPEPTEQAWRATISPHSRDRFLAAAAAVAAADDKRVELDHKRRGTSSTSSGPGSSNSYRRGVHSQRVRLGFISFDFNNHPTAQMVISIFEQVRKHRYTKGPIHSRGGDTVRAAPGIFDSVDLYIYSYGRNDGSIYRQQLAALADYFIDGAQGSHSEIFDRIRADGIDVLFDLQLHTLGTRFEITAMRPAAVQVSYLVYPGTCGSSFIDYLAGDVVVTPPEQADDYSEALLMLPPTYQISHYDQASMHLPAGGAVSKGPSTSSRASSGNSDNDSDNDSDKSSDSDRSEHSALRHQHGLPVSPQVIVFCNFNKIEKIDPDSFALWMKVLVQVPSSVLWLLEPGSGRSKTGGSNSSSSSSTEFSGHNREGESASPPGDDDSSSNLSHSSVIEEDIIKQSLREAARALGVDGTRRIVFAARVDKDQHIARHRAADLFLDTLVYGAHSTATDAIRGVRVYYLLLYVILGYSVWMLINVYHYEG